MYIRSTNFKFVPVEKKTVYAEISQSVDMKFAFPKVTCRKDVTIVEQLHDWVKCRDFLGDALYAKATKGTCSIYSFTFSSEKQKVSTRAAYVLIKYGNKAKLEAFLSTIHHYEDQFRWRRTKMWTLSDKVHLVEASKLWVSSPQLISMYTLLWRLADVGRAPEESVEDFLGRVSNMKTNDGRYLKSIQECQALLGMNEHPFCSIMRNRRRVLDKPYEGTGDISWVHNNNGILSFVQLAAGTRSAHHTFAKKQADSFKEIVKKKPVEVAQ